MLGACASASQCAEARRPSPRFRSHGRAPQAMRSHMAETRLVHRYVGSQELRPGQSGWDGLGQDLAGLVAAWRIARIVRSPFPQRSVQCRNEVRFSSFKPRYADRNAHTRSAFLFLPAAMSWAAQRTAGKEHVRGSQGGLRGGAIRAEPYLPSARSARRVSDSRNRQQLPGSTRDEAGLPCSRTNL